MATESPVVLPAASSGLSVSLHPLPILNISEHLTRSRVQVTDRQPSLVLGVLLGTQNGREIEIVNSFELTAVSYTPSIANMQSLINHAFLMTRKDQYKQVFPSQEFIGWYSVAPSPTALHISLQEQFAAYSSTSLFLLLHPSIDREARTLPIKIYEPTVEIRDKCSRSVFVEVPYGIETTEAERIAVDFSAKGTDHRPSLLTHLTSQRSAVQMLHDRVKVLSNYLIAVIEGKIPKDHPTLRAVASLLAQVPAVENLAFREEFETEFSDVQLTSYLAALTNSTSLLNDLVDKHSIYASSRNEDKMPSVGRRRGMGPRGHDMMERLM